MTVKDEFIIQRQGSDFVLYKGLLDEAHRKFDGKFSIHAELQHWAFDDKNEPQYAIARAEVKSPNGQFVEWGDATKGNVGGGIRPHLFRMALTRAKARALRDAINVGMATVEELADDDQPPARAATQNGGGSKQKTSGKKTGGSLDGEQYNTIVRLVKEVDYDGGMEGFQEKALKGHSLSSISKGVAAKVIENLEKRKAELEDEDGEVDIDEVEGVTKGGAKNNG